MDHIIGHSVSYQLSFSGPSTPGSSRFTKILKLRVVKQAEKGKWIGTAGIQQLDSNWCRLEMWRATESHGKHVVLLWSFR